MKPLDVDDVLHHPIVYAHSTPKKRSIKKAWKEGKYSADKIVLNLHNNKDTPLFNVMDIQFHKPTC